MSKKPILACLFCALVLAGISAQNLHDPYDPIYRDLERWELRTYIDFLPLIRPYPSQLVLELLTQVIENGDSDSATKAYDYLISINGGIKPRLSASGIGINGIDRDEIAPILSIGGEGNFQFEDWLTLSFSSDAFLLTLDVGDDELKLPGEASPYPDILTDTADLGPFLVRQVFNSTMAVGNPNIYFQAGLNRSSFGPFFDNGTVLGPQAPHAGHFSLVYRGNNWTASMLYLALVASDQYGNRRYPGKALVLHSFDFTLFPGFELGFFESVVYGGRFDPIYLSPFTFLFSAQALNGIIQTNWDNSFIGLSGRWTIEPGLMLKGQVYIDDLGFNDLVSFHLDTKYKLSAQAGLAWSPVRGFLDGFLETLELDYTAIMPYMYTHVWDLEPDDFNPGANSKPVFSNYLHKGENLGAELLPNSDRLSLRTNWKLFPDSNLKLGAEFLHHGNASSNYSGDVPDDYFNDGDYLDVGDNNDGRATYQDTTRFLTQSLIETILRFNMAAEFTLKTALGSFDFNAALVFEYGWNRGLLEGNDGPELLYSFGVNWKY